jgi:hypothetical protein
MAEQPQTELPQEPSYQVKAGQVEDKTGIHNNVSRFFQLAGFIQLDPGNGFSRTVYGSRRGTAVVNRETGGFGLRVYIGTADPSLLEEFTQSIPEITLDDPRKIKDR